MRRARRGNRGSSLQCKAVADRIFLCPCFVAPRQRPFHCESRIGESFCQGCSNGKQHRRLQFFIVLRASLVIHMKFAGDPRNRKLSSQGPTDMLIVSWRAHGSSYFLRPILHSKADHLSGDGLSLILRDCSPQRTVCCCRTTCVFHEKWGHFAGQQLSPLTRNRPTLDLSKG